jgi:hypothetical protein
MSTDKSSRPPPLNHSTRNDLSPGRAAKPTLASPRLRRLGAVEYGLLALITLGVAITSVMAIVNP